MCAYSKLHIVARSASASVYEDNILVNKYNIKSVRHATKMKDACCVLVSLFRL